MTDVIEEIQLKLERLPEWQASQRVLVAVSGGVDSMVLLEALHMYNSTLTQPKTLIVAHFNHRLRQESDEEAKCVKRAAERLGLTYVIQEWQTPAMRNIEANARQARYEFFAEVIRNEEISLLLTGHHLNDLVETMLMRLARGSSLKGMRGIDFAYRRVLNTANQLPVSVHIVRPLLQVPKKVLYEYALQHHVVYCEDSSNQDTRFFRNRVRHQLLPLFEQENPHFLEQMLNLQEQLLLAYDVQFQQYMQVEPELLTYHPTEQWILYVPAFSKLNDSQRKVYLTLFFEERLVECVPEYTKEAIFRLENLILNHRTPNAQFQLNEQWIVRREYDFVYIQEVRDTYDVQDARIHIEQLNRWYTISETEKIGLFESHVFSHAQMNEYTYKVRLMLRDYQLKGFHIRHRKTGDRLELNDGNGHTFHKKVSRYMIDQKIPSLERQKIWLLCDRYQEVISIVGYINSRKYQIKMPEARTYWLLYSKIQD